jgi:tRNA (guanine6-N2)-methyltransferase
MIYNLKFIEGTIDLVKAELLSHFLNVKILSENRNLIAFESTVENIDEFRVLKKSLHIERDLLSRNIFRRDWKVESNPAGINPSLANILATLAQVTHTDTVLDPFCGAGTIPIIAATEFGAKKAIGSDLSGKSIDMAIKNASAANISSKRITFFRSGINQVKLQKESIDKLISNLPFGIRVSDHSKNIKAYRSLASRAKVFMKKEGRVVLYTQEKELVWECFKKEDFELIEHRTIFQGGLHPDIFVFSIK